MKRLAIIIFYLSAPLSPATAVLAPVTPPANASRSAVGERPANYEALTELFVDWRAFATPALNGYLPDYSDSAMAEKKAALPDFMARLKAIDTVGWPVDALADYRLVQAEMNGMDFDFRVLHPWSRDPTFYATVFADWSDVPAHEGPYAYPNINLYDFKFPLDVKEQAKLTAMLASVPKLLESARENLKSSNARDLWVYGGAAFRQQSAVLSALEAGTLTMRTLDGRLPATMTGATPALLHAIRAARRATDRFATWIAEQAPGKTGPSGVGKDNYNWYVANVELLPYDWDQQVLLLRRELDRAISSLTLEELRNSDVPPVRTADDPAAYRRMAAEKTAFFSAFMESKGFAEARPEYRSAMAAQTPDYVPPDRRDFFSHVTSQDPLPLVTHASHWIDLARLKYQPSASPIRRTPPLYNIFANRSEGLATAFEEIVMQAGMYDNIPHGRELVWIMLANRAARGLASLYVQSNEMTLAQAGKFHAEWTPRGWSNPESPLVAFEQLLYARQPGYGPSYIIGKLQIDGLIADAVRADDAARKPFVMRDFIGRMMGAGILPVALIHDEVIPPKPQ